MEDFKAGPVFRQVDGHSAILSSCLSTLKYVLIWLKLISSEFDQNNHVLEHNI